MKPYLRPSALLINTLAVALWFVLTPANATSPFKTERWTTTQGTQVVFYPSMEVPMLDIGIAFKAGSAYDGHAFGLSALTSQLINQGNGGQSADTIADALSDTGAQFNAVSNKDMIVLGLRTLTNPNALQQSSNTFATIITQPDFPEEAFHREKNRQSIAIKQTQDMPEMMAQETFYQTLYRQHPYGHPLNGNQETLSTITLDQVRQFYQRYFVARNAVIVLVGAIDTQTAHELAEKITHKLPKGIPAPPILPASPLTEEMNIEVTYRSSQTVVLLGQLGISHHDKAFFALQVGNYILGGNPLASRLGHALREERGLTYGVNSQFSPMPGRGPFMIRFTTKHNQATTATDITRETLASFIKSGPTDNELTAAKHYLSGSFPLSLASNQNIAEILLKLAVYNLPDDFLSTYTDRINAVTAADITTAFQQTIHPSQLLLVAVGSGLSHEPGRAR